MISKCPQCSQLLAIPDDIGGMLMECPSCGKKLYSDFKIKNTTTTKTSSQCSKKEDPTPPPKITSGFSVKI